MNTAVFTCVSAEQDKDSYTHNTLKFTSDQPDVPYEMTVKIAVNGIPFRDVYAGKKYKITVEEVK